jgi:NH3-dependent NAD+ synthetase
LHVEFAGVAADVDQISQNLMVLLQYLKENHNKYTELIEKTNDSEIKANADIVNKFYGKLVEEVERQLAVLNNIIGNVIKPTGKDLIALVQKSDDFKGMVENIKNELGSKEFGEKLGYVLSGVSDSAEAAKIVEQALKEVGLSIAEYRNTRGVEDLKNKIFEALSRSGKQLGGDEIVKFVKAADVLYRYDFRQPQILEYLKKAGGEEGGKPDRYTDENGVVRSAMPGNYGQEIGGVDPTSDEITVDGGGCGCEGADGGRPNFGAVFGGADGKNAEDIFERKTDLKQSISEKTRELDRFREQLFNDFEKSMLTHYRNVVGIVAQIGPKLGNEIPIDENVRAFVRHFSQMDTTNRNNIARALSGYNKSGASIANRNRFIADFAKLLTLAAPLASKSSLFKDLENEIKELNNLIDIFGEKFVKAIQAPLNPRVKGPYAKGGDGSVW